MFKDNPSLVTLSTFSLSKMITRWKIIMILSLLLSIPLHITHSSTCSSSVSSTNAIKTQTQAITPAGSNTKLTTALYKWVQGQISNNLYQLYYYYNGGYKTAVRRVNEDDSIVWMTAIDGLPNMKSLVVDSSEQYLYFANSYDCIMSMYASTGQVIDWKKL